MSARLAALRAQWAARTPRERLLLTVAGGLLALLLLFVLVLGPARAARAAAVERHADAARTLGVVARATAAPPSVRGSGGPLRAVVAQSADAAGLVIDRYDSAGDDLRVSLGEAPAPALFAWLTALREEEGIVAAEAQLRREEGGVVSARLTLRRAS